MGDSAEAQTTRKFGNATNILRLRIKAKFQNEEITRDELEVHPFLGSRHGMQYWNARKKKVAMRIAPVLPLVKEPSLESPAFSKDKETRTDANLPAKAMSPYLSAPADVRAPQRGICR